MVNVSNIIPIGTNKSPNAQITFKLNGLEGPVGDTGKLNKSSFNVDIAEEGVIIRAVSSGSATDDFKIVYDINVDETIDVKITRESAYKSGKTIRVTINGEDNATNAFKFVSNFTISNGGILGTMGAVWWSLTVADLIPALDPDREGSLADKMQDFIEEASDTLDDKTKKITNLTNQISSLASQVGQVAKELENLQKELEELVGNFVNTGAYVRVVGLDFKINNNQEFINRVQQVMFDFQDPNRPDFRGDTAYIGGFMMLVGGANPLALKDQLVKLKTLFPFLRNLIGDLTSDEPEEPDNLIFENNKGLLDLNDLKGSESYQNASSFEAPEPVDNSSLFESNGSNQGPQSFFDDIVGKIPDQWIAMRISDLFGGDLFDLNNPDSVLSKIMKTEKDAANKIIGVVKQADDLASTVNNITNDINQANREIQRLGQKANEFMENLATTGIFAHFIGADLTLQNNLDFVRGVRDAMNDESDPNQPKFKGDTALVAGVLLVVGAPNPMGLADEISKLTAVFGGIQDKALPIPSLAGDIFKK